MCYELEHAFYYVGQIRTIRAAKQPQAERLFHRSRKICGQPCRGACLIGFPEPAQRRPRSTSQQRTAPRFSGGKENRSPAQRVRFGKEEPRCERALTFKKVGASGQLAPTWWRRVDSNHRSETQQIYSLPPLATRELLHMKLWSWWTDSNPRPADYKSAALPAELHQQLKSAVQQQVLFYQKVYTLSTTFFKFFFFLFLPLIRPLRPSPLRRGGRLFQSKGGGAPREC